MILSSVLIFSILAPPIINLLSETESFVYIEKTDEEKTEKIEKDIEEKIIQFSNSNLKLSNSLNKNNSVFYYIENISNHYSKIVLPPPEHII
jgi:hypothetical protein